MQSASATDLCHTIAQGHRTPDLFPVRPMNTAHPMARRQTRLEPSCLKAATVRPAFVHLVEGVINILLLILPNHAPGLPLCVGGRLTINRRLCSFARRIVLCLALGALQCSCRHRPDPCLCSTDPAEPMRQRPPLRAANCSPRAVNLPEHGADRAVRRLWSRTLPLPPHVFPHASCRIIITCRCRHGLPPHVCYRIGSCRCRCRHGWILGALASGLLPTCQSWL